MIVWVDDLLFERDAHDVDRIALLRNAAIRRHTLIVSGDPWEMRAERDAPHFDSWRVGLPDRLRSEIEELGERLDRVSGNSVTRGAGRLLVSASPRPDTGGCWLSIREAVRAVALPLHVLVEHQLNDAAFIRRVMPPEWRKRLEAWERRGELHYVNGGGATVMASLVDFHTNDENARRAFGLPSELWKYVHFVIYDHDGDCAEKPGKDSRELARSCDSAGLNSRNHRLQRRDQEHYLPIEALKAIVEERITDPDSRASMFGKIEVHAALDDTRHFEKLPRLGKRPFFKGQFAKPLPWSDDWFHRDGAWSEMTQLAEKIAAAM